MVELPSFPAADGGPRTTPSAAKAERYRRLLAVFDGYVSRSNAKVSLDVALTRLGLRRQRIATQDLERVVAETMIGLRLFCSADRVGDLMVDLAEFCAAETSLSS